MVRRNKTQTQTQTQTQVTVNPKDRSPQEQLSFEKWILELIDLPEKKQKAIIDLAVKNNDNVKLQPERKPYAIRWEEPIEYQQIRRFKSEVINPQSERFWQTSSLKLAGLLPEDIPQDKIYPILQLVSARKYVVERETYYDATYNVVAIDRINRERRLEIEPHRYYEPRVTYRLAPADLDLKNGKQIRLAEIFDNDGLQSPYMKLIKKFDEAAVKRDFELYSHGRQVGVKGHISTTVPLTLVMSGRNPFTVSYEDFFRDSEQVYKDYNEPKPGLQIPKEFIEEIERKRRDPKVTAYA